MGINDEIDAIINKAMQEYNIIHGIEYAEECSTAISSNQSALILEKSEEEPNEESALIKNSNSFLVEETTSRFSSAIWYDKIRQSDIIMAGVGGIGSFVAFLLSRVKPRNIILYDSDIVEAGNMSGQLYGTDDINNFKASAICGFMSKYSDFRSFTSINQNFTSNSIAGPVMICGFDNMEARKIFFNSWLSYVNLSTGDHKKECLFIDGRLAAEEFQVIAIQGTDDRAIKEYSEKWLFNDDEADETICSYKQTSFCANMIASVMVNIFVNFIANLCEPLVPRDVPFLTEYNAETMFFKITQ